MWAGEIAVNPVGLVDPEDGTLPKHGYPVIEHDGECLGYVKMTALAAAAGLTSIPAEAKRAVVQCEGMDVRWRADGVNPTATDGMLLADGSERTFALTLSTLKFIQVAAGAILHVSYFS